jgi:Putative metallopeptidase
MKPFSWLGRSIAIASTLALTLGAIPAQAAPSKAIQTKIQAIAQTTLSAHPEYLAARGQGRFYVTYGNIRNQDNAVYQSVLKDARFFEEIATTLNQFLKLPSDIEITVAECGKVNAFYDPRFKRLTMCTELIGHYVQTFKPVSKTNEEMAESVLYTTLFVFFHELGHGLVDIYDLPVTGKEEDAVDDFSTVLLLEMGEPGYKAVLSTAHWFAIEGGQADVSNLAFWDEHSLDMQRFFNIACLAYGKEPQTFEAFVSSGLLPQARAVRCGEEYAKKRKSWDTLLSGHSK